MIGPNVPLICLPLLSSGILEEDMEMRVPILVLFLSYDPLHHRGSYESLLSFFFGERTLGIGEEPAFGLDTFLSFHESMCRFCDSNIIINHRKIDSKYPILFKTCATNI